MTDDRLPWFQCFPEKWLVALSGMKPDEGYLYLIVCLRIYEAGRACPDTLESLARRSGLNKRRTSDALDKLFRSGKLVREPDGIMNPFAALILAEAKAYREGRARAGQKGGSATAEKRKQNQDQPPSTAMLLPLANGSHLQLQEQVQKKDRETRASRRAPRKPISADWKPSQVDLEYAGTCRFEQPDIDRMARAFVNYHQRQGTMIAGAVGLAASWRTWCDNEVRFRARDKRKGDPGLTMYEIATGGHR